MKTTHLRSGTIARTCLATLAVLSAVVTGCSVQAAGSSPAPASAAQAPVASAAGPTAYAAWTERQGFGGSAGLNNIAKLARWVRDNPGEETAWNNADETKDIASLAAWLDSHPATSCWADYHATVRASLASLLADYAEALAPINANESVPGPLADRMVADAEKAQKLPDPPNCP